MQETERPKTFRVAVIEDSKPLRDLYSDVLSGSNMEVLGFFCVELFEPLMEREDCDLVLIDLHLPGEQGLAFLERRQDLVARIPFVVISSSNDTDIVVSAIKAGAVNYLVKPILPEKLLAVVEEPYDLGARGQSATTPELRQKISTLTPRERQVFDQIMVGASGKQIARALGISPRTAEIHKTNIFRKLGVANASELVLYVSGRLNRDA